MHTDRRDKLLRVFLRALPLAIVPGPELSDLFKDLTKTRTDIDTKVREAHSALSKASTLVSELDSTLKDRADHLNELRAAAERLSKLAAIEEQKAAPLLKELERTLGRNRGRERTIAFVINLAAGLLIFFLGVWMAPRIRDPSPATPRSVTDSSSTTRGDPLRPGASARP